MVAPILLAILAPAAAQVAVPLQPTGKWVLEGENNMCALLRTFGEGKSEVTLGIRPWPLGGHTDILLFVSGNHDGFGRDPESLMFDTGTPIKTGYESYILAKKNVRLAIATYTENAIAPIEGAKEATIAFSKDAVFPMALPDMEPALKALANCNNLLRNSLGIDPAWQEKIKVSATPQENPQRWYKEGTYPGSPLMFGVQGMSRMLMTINPDGRVSQCVTFGSSGNAKLDEFACKGFLLNGRFNPARDQHGDPIVGYFVFGLDFRILPPSH